MPSRLVLTSFLTALSAGLALSSLACTRVRVDDVRGPDGKSDWQSVTCNHMNRRCFDAAARLCPNGYYFARAAGTVPAAGSRADVDDDDDATASTSAPAPQGGVNVTRLPPQERWGSGMYSRRRGTILVRCASARTTASR